MWKLYLDDLRTPKTDGWKISRTVNSAIDRIMVDGVPSEMSLDHDLGENVPDGYDFIKWFFNDYVPRLVDKEPVKRMKINVHSANPVGAKNIEEFVKCARRHYENY